MGPSRGVGKGSPVNHCYGVSGLVNEVFKILTAVGSQKAKEKSLLLIQKVRVIPDAPGKKTEKGSGRRDSKTSQVLIGPA